MTHDEKVAHFIADMKARGLDEKKVVPPIMKLLWKRGWTVRPPMFAKFVPLMLILGGFFALLWGAFMWFLIWGPEGKPIAPIIGAVVSAGLMFGATVAWLIQRPAKKMGLPAWEDYPPK